jgi:WD40 repeat protein
VRPSRLHHRVRAWLAALWRRVVWLVSGPDIFLSYSREDGASYAAGLAVRLVERSRDFHCFLDQWDSPPGRRIPRRVLLALRRSTMLVIVGTKGAARSRAVRQEIRHFRKGNWRIVPITFRGEVEVAVESAPWFRAVDGLPREREDEAALTSGVPSDAVVQRIDSSYVYSRRNRRVRRTLATSGIGLFLLTLVSGWAMLEASHRQRETTARRLVLDANELRAERGPSIATSVLLAVEASRRLSELGRERADAIRSLSESLALVAPSEGAVRLPHGVADVRILPDERHVLAVTADSEAYLVDLDHLQSAPTLVARGWKTVAASDDGATLFVAGARGAGVWRLPERAFVPWPEAPTVDVVTVSADGSLVAVGDPSPRVWIWHVADSARHADEYALDGLVPLELSLTGGRSPQLVISSRTPPIPRYASLTKRAAWVIDVESGKKRFLQLDFDSALEAMVSSPSAEHLVTATRQRRGGRGFSYNPLKLSFWNVTDLRPGYLLLPRDTSIREPDIAPVRSVSIDDPTGITDIAVSPRGDRIAIVIQHQLQLWDFEGSMTPIAAAPHEVVASVFDHHGRRILALNADRTARLYDIQTGGELYRITERSQPTAAAFDTSGGRLVTGHADGTLKVWQLRRAFQEPDRPIESDGPIAVSGDRRVVAATHQGTASLWWPGSWERLGRADSLQMAARAIAVNGDGSLLAVAAQIGYGSMPTYALAVYSRRTDSLRVPPRNLTGSITEMAVSNTHVLSRVVGGTASPIVLASLNLDDGRLTWPFGTEPESERPRAPGEARQVILAPDASAAVALVDSNEIALYDAKTGTIRRSRLDDGDEPLLLGADRTVVVTGPPAADWLQPLKAFERDGAATVRDVTTLRRRARFPVRKGEQVLGLSPDSRYILTEPDSSSVRLVDARSGSDVVRVTSPVPYYTFAFSADSRFLAVAFAYRQVIAGGEYIRVFDTRTGWQVGNVPLSPTPFFNLAFNAQGDRLLTITRDVAHAWRWQLPDLLDAACQAVGSDLSAEACAQYLPGERCPPLCASRSRAAR